MGSLRTIKRPPGRGRMRWIARIVAAAALSFVSYSSVFHLPLCRGLRAEWIPVHRDGSGGTLPQPRRSGHVSFRYDHGRPVTSRRPDVFTFGGYAEVDAKDPGSKERFVVNDLWRWRQRQQQEGDRTVEGGWFPVKIGQRGATSDEEGAPAQTCDSSEASHALPRARLVSAAAVLDDYAYVVGGWDPGVPGTGGEILASCHRLGPLSSAATSASTSKEDETDAASTRIASKELPLEWTRLPDFPDGPTSRHAAVALPPSGDRLGRIVVHNHRCVDHVWVLDSESAAASASSTDPARAAFVKQPTRGDPPSPRGLHAATVVGKDKVVVFGGAAQDGTMSNEVFVLDASTWTWTKPSVSSRSDAMPCPRAAPCLVALDDTTAILYGGAEATSQGLQPLGDVWAFDVTTSAWRRLVAGPESSSASGQDVPPPRNAATLTCISAPQDYSELGYRDYVLAGGWHPFVQTWDDCYVLRIHRQ
jgi:Galactose oxidase, central domain